MRIAHLVSSLQVGGAEVIALQLAEEQARAGHAVEVIALRDGPLRSRLSDAVHLTCFEKRGLGLRLAVMRHALTHPVDVMNSHNPSAQRLAGFARVGKWPRIVMTLHGEASRTYHRVTTSLTLDHLVAVSTRVAESWREKHPRFPSERLTTIDNGVAVGASFLPRPPLGSLPTILVVARLDPIKDLGTALRAIALLRARRPVRLVIAGDGIERAPLEAEARNLGISDAVEFLGMVHDVAPLYAAADLFCLSSISEGMSLAILEAMSAGVPVVATDVGGTPDILTDGGTGLLVPPQDPAAMAHALGRLLDDVALRRRLAEAAWSRVAQRYSIAATAQRYVELYDRLRNI